MKHVLVVDDNITNLKVAKAALETEYKVTILTSGMQMLKFLEKNAPDLILLDIEMPVLDGFGVVEKLKEDGQFGIAPIIFLTAITSSEIESKALSMGIVDFINKPFVNETLLSRVKLHLEISDYRKNLEVLVEEKTKMVEDLQDAISVSIAELVGCRDGYTGEHINRSCTYLKILAEKMLSKGIYPDELNEKLVSDMLRSAALHDIGKVGIKDEILCKPGRFTDEEFTFMKEHTKLGGKTLQSAIDQTGSVSFLYVARDMAFYHHEKWDGTGYVFGLNGEEIPLCARIMAIADVYDALTSKRPYKEPFPHEKAVQIITEGKGTHFDPLIVDIFLDCADEFERTLQVLGNKKGLV